MYFANLGCTYFVNLGNNTSRSARRGWSKLAMHFAKHNPECINIHELDNNINLLFEQINRTKIYFQTCICEYSTLQPDCVVYHVNSVQQDRITVLTIQIESDDESSNYINTQHGMYHRSCCYK